MCEVAAAGARADMMAACAILAEQAGEPPVSVLLRGEASRELALVSSRTALEPPCSGSIHDREDKAVVAATGGLIVGSNAPGAPEGPSQVRARRPPQ